ncbi:MAG: hypothetical protein U0V87_08880 [Acidobacteriota bacterium]
MKRPPVLVDGHNLLLSLARLEDVPDSMLDLRQGERDLAAILAEWGALRERSVTIAWDGRAALPDVAGVRQIRLSPPAEADDFLVQEAHRLRREGVVATVVSRDRELLSRLPVGTLHLPMEQLADDLQALLADPLRAPHLKPDDGDLERLPPATTRPFPRRRSAPQALEAASSTRSSRLAPRAAAPPVDAARSSDESKKAARREKYQRAQERKKR